MAAPPMMNPNTGGVRTPLAEELNSLKICLGLPGSIDPNGEPRKATCVIFKVTVEGQHEATLECSAREVGLPQNVTLSRSVRFEESSLQLPEHIVASLDEMVPHTGVPLWLSFPLPCGYLPAVPWERLLRARMKLPPILRLSYQPVQPITPRDSRDIALCFSFARAKDSFMIRPPQEILAYFFDDFPPNIAAYTTFHLFTDSSLFHDARALRDRYRGIYKIELYDPAEAERFSMADPTSAESDSDPLDSQWMRWIRGALGTRSVDIVHLVCHGYLGREDGFVALSESPVAEMDTGFARFVGARQICALLDQVGAWSVAFSSPPGNYSKIGLRLLQDQVSRNRPGPVLYHDMESDPDAKGLHEAYEFAYAIEEAYPPQSGEVSLSCHPEWAMPWTQGDAASRRLLNELTLAGSMEEVLEGSENTPSWLASGQRALESSLATLVSSCQDEPERLLDSGAAEALRFTAKLLQEHAQTLRSTRKEEAK